MTSGHNSQLYAVPCHTVGVQGRQMNDWGSRHTTCAGLGFAVAG